jgi:hypothetical protein
MPIRRAFYYRPLAILLGLLLVLPHISQVAGSRQFQAAAQTAPQAQLPSCSHPTLPGYGNPIRRIIDATCDTSSGVWKADLEKLEVIAVTQYLTIHRLPVTEAATLYAYGRSDLRSEIRGTIFNIVKGILLRAPQGQNGNYGNLDPWEIRIYQWIEHHFKNQERDFYAAAVADKNAFLANDCKWKPDPDIAKAYNLVYYPSNSCQNGYVPPVGPSYPTVPSVGYFLGAAYKKIYGRHADFEGGPELMNQTAINAASAAIGVSAAIAFIAAVATMGTTVATWATGTVPLILATFLPHAGLTSAFTLSLGSLIGVVAVPILMYAVGIMMVIQLVNFDQQIEALKSLDKDLAWVNRAEWRPDMAGQAGDTFGNLKLLSVFVPFTVSRMKAIWTESGWVYFGDSPSKAAIPAHQSTDPNFRFERQGVDPWVRSSWFYVDPSGVAHEVWMRGGWFVLRQFSYNPGPLERITTTLRVKLANGHWGTVERAGANFLIVDVESGAGAADCSSLDPVTGVSITGSTPCRSWYSAYVDVNASTMGQVDWDPPTRISVAPPPVILSSSIAPFNTAGPAGQTFTIAATNNAAISISGALPAGVTFTPGNGQATLSYTRPPGSGNARMPVTVQAVDAAGGTGTQTLTISIEPNLQFLSPNKLTLTIGVPGGQAVQVAGGGYIGIKPKGLGGGNGTAASPYIDLPPGLTFTDYGGGSALLSGTPLPGATGCSGAVTGCGFVATQAGGNFPQTVTQLFELTILQPPAAQYNGPTAATFNAGVPNSFTLTSSGAKTAVTWSADALPAWLQLVPAGPGVARLEGTPPAGVTGAIPLVLKLATYGIATPASINFTVSVPGVPQFVSPNTGQCTIMGNRGVMCGFDVRTNQVAGGGATITMTGAPPPGMALTDNGDGSAVVKGVTAVPGLYPMQFTASNAFGAATQNFYFRVLKAPNIISMPSTTFHVGIDNVFTIVTTGYPTQPDSGPGAIPNSTGMVLSVIGALPPWLRFTQANGNGVLSGTPPAGSQGSYAFQVHATNQVSEAIQTFTLAVTDTPAMSAQTLLAGTGQTGLSRVGSSVALSADGNTAVAGGPGDDNEKGAVWVYSRSGSFGQQGTKLIGSGGAATPGQQGHSSAISADGSTIVAAAPGQGSLWVFGRVNGAWSQTAGPIAAGAGGVAVATAPALPGGTRIVSGDPANNRVLELVPTGGGVFSPGPSATVADAAGNARLGTAIAISADGNTLIAGGPGDNNNAGAAWIFTRHAGGWTQLAKLTPAGAAGAAQFGSAVALSSDGSTAAVGGPDDNGNAGGVWVFFRSAPGAAWTQQGAKLTAKDAAGPARLGSSVAVSGNGAVVMAGGPMDAAFGLPDGLGAAWFFTRQNGAWTQAGGKQVGAGANGNARQGSSVALSGDGNIALSGGPKHLSGAGAVWAYGTADLTIAISRAGAFVPLQNGAYTVTVSNAGSDFSMPGASWSVALPGNLKPAGITAPAGWNCSSLGCTATTTSLPAGGSVPFTLAVTVAGAGPATAVASVTGLEMNTSNNSASDTTVIGQSTPVVTWFKPPAILYGSALGSGQLNATANVPGTFVYTPPAGTVLPVGNGQTLSVTFTPNDPASYSAATATTSIDVLPQSAPSTVAKLVVTQTFSRNASNQVVASLKVANTGGAAAQNVTLTTAKIGTIVGTPLPKALGPIPAGGQIATTVTFPAAGIAAPGSPAVFAFSGTYTGGTFSGSARIVLP